MAASCSSWNRLHEHLDREVHHPCTPPIVATGRDRPHRGRAPRTRRRRRRLPAHQDLRASLDRGRDRSTGRHRRRSPHHHGRPRIRAPGTRRWRGAPGAGARSSRRPRSRAPRTGDRRRGGAPGTRDRAGEPLRRSGSGRTTPRGSAGGPRARTESIRGAPSPNRDAASAGRRGRGPRGCADRIRLGCDAR